MPVDSSNSTAGTAVTGAIRRAAQATGTRFQYPLATAQQESEIFHGLFADPGRNGRLRQW